MDPTQFIFIDFFISSVFALIVFLCDDLVSLSVPAPTDDEAATNTRRFFAIAAALPMDLQMVLCNRMYGSHKDLVLTKHSEPAFKRLAKRYLVNTFTSHIVTN